jgi:hypothetical protein
MKLIHWNGRLWVLAIAIAVLGGIAAWQLSGTAQAHGDRAATPRARAERPARRHPSTPGSNRIQPGGAIVGFACYVVRGGIEGLRPLATCPDQALPPGFAVPLGR